MNDGQEQSSNSAPSELDLLKQRAKMMGVVYSNNIKIETLRAKIQAKLNDEDDTQIKDENNEDQVAEDQNREDTKEAGSGSSGNSNEGDAGNGSSGTEEAEPVAASGDTGTTDHQSALQEVIETAPMEAPAPIVAPVVQAAPKPAPTPTATPVAPAMEVPAKVARKLNLREFMQREHMKLIRVRIANLDPKKKDLPGEIFTVANEFIGTVKKYIPYGEMTDDGWHVPKILYEQLRERKFLNISTTKDRRSGHIQTKQVWVKEFALEVLPDLTQEELNHLAIAQAAAGSVEGQL